MNKPEEYELEFILASENSRRDELRIFGDFLRLQDLSPLTADNMTRRCVDQIMIYPSKEAYNNLENFPYLITVSMHPKGITYSVTRRVTEDLCQASAVATIPLAFQDPESPKLTLSDPILEADMQIIAGLNDFLVNNDSFIVVDKDSNNKKTRLQIR